MILGVLGAGQLGMMLAQAAHQLGASTRFLDPNPRACARRSGELIVGEYADTEALDRFAEGLTAATYEFENVDPRGAAYLAKKVAVRPSPDALVASRDRLNEKRLLESAGIPVPEWRAIDSIEDLRSCVEAIGAPCILKARTGGYDGKGQARIRGASDIEQAWEAIGRRPAICERMIPFTRELSVIAARSQSGEVLFYPTNESHHSRGILIRSISPAPSTDSALVEYMHARIRDLLDSRDYIGVFTVELFETGDALLANETAPRVHNTGHWTIEGTTASQFENHARAVLGMPLAPIEPTHPCCAMLNIIGVEPNPALAQVPGATVHLYGKSPKPGRKIGHCTISADSLSELYARIERAEAIYAPLLRPEPV